MTLEEKKEYVSTRALQAVGFCVANNVIRDEDTNEIVLYNGAFIRTIQSPIRYSHEAVYDPVMNKKLAIFLFNVLIKKMTDEGEIRVSVITESRSKVPQGVKPKISVCIITDDGEISGKGYTNVSLSYLDLIFKLAHITDCTPFLMELDAAL